MRAESWRAGTATIERPNGGRAGTRRRARRSRQMLGGEPVSRCRGRRLQRGAALAPPRPTQRGRDALDPARPAHERRQAAARRACEPFCGNAFGLDELLVGACCCGRWRGSRRPAVAPVAGRNTAPASHSQVAATPAGVPVGDALRVPVRRRAAPQRSRARRTRPAAPGCWPPGCGRCPRRSRAR